MSTARQTQEGPGENGAHSTAKRPAMDLTSSCAWGLGLLFVCLGVASLLAPRVGAFLSARGVVVLFVGAVCFAAIGFASVRSRRVPSGLAALSRDLEAMTSGVAATRLEAPPCPELAALVERLNRLLSQVQGRERASKDLLASNRLLARELRCVLELLNLLKEGVVFLASAEQALFANRAAAPFLRVSPADVRDRTAQECIRDAAVLGLLAGQDEAGMARGTRTIELSSDGGAGGGHVAVSHVCGFGGDDAPIGQALVFRDISQEKEAQKTQAEFLDSVAHEFRTPLTSIRASVEMLIDNEAKDPESQFRFYNIIHEETYRLSQLIDNLLNLSMIESGATAVKIAPVRLRKLLEDCVDVVRPQCEEKRINLTADLPDRLPTLDIDKSLFTVAVMNILGNAVKYTPRGGTVTLSTLSREEEFIISIQDTGIGIPEEELPRIFEKFYRCASPNGQEVPGSGVGLATALQIVQVHGGSIQVTSRRGEGSTFSMVLPRSIINTTVGD